MRTLMQTESEIMAANGLIHAVELDAQGGCRRMSREETLGGPWPDALVWAHFNRKDPESVRFLRETSGLDSVICDALLDDSTRPRSVQFENGIVVIMRGVNLNPGEDPEDMISMRLWIDDTRIISLRASKLQAASDVLNLLESKIGPKSPGGFLVTLAEALNDRITPVVDELEERVENVHEETGTVSENQQLRRNLSELRRRAIALRRYIAPQRDMVRSLQRLSIDWLTIPHQIRLREAQDQLTGFVEDLDATRDHAYVAQDDIQSMLSDQMNRKMYLLSVIAGVFLPLGFLTGLLGVNVGGIPGSDSPIAFAIFCGMLAVLIVIQLILFRKMKWL